MITQETVLTPAHTQDGVVRRIILRRTVLAGSRFVIPYEITKRIVQKQNTGWWALLFPWTDLSEETVQHGFQPTFPSPLTRT